MREPQPIKFARHLRRNESDAERKLWSKLRSRQFQNLKFRRQQPLGKYIVDFVSFEKKIIIEVDGSQHMEPRNNEKDMERTTYFEDEGYMVLRFWNNDILTNIEGVGLKLLEQINLLI
jgi:very-short-patch-repair endonuclease